MIIWGGEAVTTSVTPVDSSSYSPSGDRWTPLSTTNTPTGRRWPSGVWAGDRAIFWGGQTLWNASTVVSSGGTPGAGGGSWSPINLSGAPTPRALHTASWSGTEMIVVGGRNGAGSFGDAPACQTLDDSWRSLPAPPAAISEHAAVYDPSTGSSRLPPSISVLLTKADHCSSSTTKLNHDLSPMCLG